MNFDESLFLSKEQIVAHIDNMRNLMIGFTDFETSIQLGSVWFPKGQLFEDWMADKQMQVSNIKQEEIIQ